MSRCLSSCVAVSAKQSTIIIHTSVRAEDCSRSSAGAYRSRDNLPHAITVCARQPCSERPERMKRARKRAGARKRQRALRSKSLAKQKQLATFSIDLFNKARSPLMSRCLSSCVAVSAKQSTIITHTSVRAEDCSRSSAGAYRSRDNLPHAITVCVSNLIASTVPECMKRARKRGAPRSTGNPVGANPTWARGSSPTQK